MYTEEPHVDDVARLEGWTLLDFGTPWCGHCQQAAPMTAEFVARCGIRHIGVEDGRGRPLGRAFRVKLWPTLVLLKDGEEQARVVRPQAHADLETLVRTVAATAR